MKIEYILVLKEKNSPKTISIKPRIQNILKKCYDNVGTNSFEIKYKRINYVIHYECATHRTDSDGNSTVYYLTFSYGTSENEITASVLDFVHTCFNSKINTGEMKFHVTISYDERALYFCARAYPYFSEFESKLRSLILKLLTQTFGTLWAQKTLTEDQIRKLKEKTHGGSFEKIASEALYEMDFSSLESYLFAKIREVSPEYIIDNYLDYDSLKELDIDKISSILDWARPKSNWERYFADKIVIEQLEEKLTIIREERNKVAHIKHYSKKDFDEDKLILCRFNLKLDEAIRSIEVSNLTIEDGFEAIMAFGLLLVGLSSVSSAIKRASEASQAIAASFSNSMVNKVEFDMSALKAAQASLSKNNMTALKVAQESLSKNNMSALKVAQASLSKNNMSAIRAAQARVSKIDKSEVSASKVKLEELQRLRTSLLNSNERYINTNYIDK